MDDCEFAFVYKKFIISYISSGNHQKDPKGASKTCFKLNKNAISGCFRQFSSDFEAVCRGTLQWNPQTSGHCGRSILACIQELQKAFLGDGSNRHWITPLSLWPGAPWPKPQQNLFNPDLRNKEVVWWIFWRFLLRLMINKDCRVEVSSFSSGDGQTCPTLRQYFSKSN